MKTPAKSRITGLLALLLLTSTLSACSFSPPPTNPSQPAVPQAVASVQNQTLLNRITLVLQGGQRLHEFQSQLPSIQMEKPSVAELNQYFQILRTFNSTSSPITWTPMKPEQMNRYLKQSRALSDIPSEGYWIEFQSSNRSHKFPFFLQKSDESGNPLTLSKTWINQSIKLYSYAQMYYQALMQQDRVSLDQLLSSIQDSELRQKRIDAALSYYPLLQQSQPDVLKHLEVTAWRADRIEIEQPLPASFLDAGHTSDTSNPPTRRLFLDLLPNGDVYVRDIIPTPWNNERMTLYQNQHQLISLNQPVDTNTLQRIFGRWEEAYFHPNAEGSSNGWVEIHYPGLILHVQGSAETATSFFTGKLSAISCSTDRYHLMNQEKVSMPLKDLQLLYPFLQENDYSLSFLHARIQFSLAADGTISELLLIGDGDPMWKQEN